MDGGPPMAVPKPTLLIACGALGQEITQLINTNGYSCFDVQCLPADWHNHPDRITPAMKEKITAAKQTGMYSNILALYGDCGTGGMLDQMLNEEGVERIPGAHCYEFFSGSHNFEDLMEEELGTFFLTDYLVRFFDRLIIKGLGIDKHPELQNMYFGNYKRLVYLAQIDDTSLDAKAKAAADRLGLSFERRKTGYGGLDTFLTLNASETA
jgi:hypothetical protein